MKDDSPKLSLSIGRAGWGECKAITELCERQAGYFPTGDTPIAAALLRSAAAASWPINSS